MDSPPPPFREERIQRFNRADLYVVITEQFCGGRDPLDILDAVLAAGVTLIQLREKELGTRALLERAVAFRDRTEKAGALFIMNDRVDIAMAVKADGVHLGQDDLPIEATRIIAPDLIIGASNHSLDEALTAQRHGADYVNIGPIFPTSTKTVATGPVGPGLIAEITPHLHIPFSCMGGIKAHNIGEVVAQGAKHPAVVTAVTEAADPEAAARELRELVTG